jgi:hypothetical protein
MVAILGKLLTKNRQFQMLITFEPFIRFLQLKVGKEKQDVKYRQGETGR